MSACRDARTPLGALAVALVAVGARRPRWLGAAKSGGTPEATPVASPALTTVLSGTPPVTGGSDALGRATLCCNMECATPGKYPRSLRQVCGEVKWAELDAECNSAYPEFCNNQCFSAKGVCSFG